MIVRLGRMAVRQSAEERAFFAALGRYLASSGSSPRNQVIYSSVFWRWPDDLTLYGGSKSQKEAMCDAPDGYPKLMEVLDELYRLNAYMMGRLADHVGFDASIIHPLAGAPAPRALAC